MLPQQVLSIYNAAPNPLPLERLVVADGETVAVLLLSRGFPKTEEEQDRFYLKGIKTLSKFRRFLPQTILKAIAKQENRQLLEDCVELESVIHSFDNLKTDLQKKLGIKLNKSYPNVCFKIYNVQMFSEPKAKEVLENLKKEGISKLVLLPLYPQFSVSNTDALFQNWLKEVKGCNFSQICVPEYATHPKLIAAFAERLGEALQRFPKAERDEVAVLFTAPSIPENEPQKPLYTQLVREGVKALLHERAVKHWQIAFLKPILFGKYFLRPWATDALADFAKKGHKSALIVPVSYLFDHFDTTYILEVKRRQNAEALGFKQYEVMSGLNSHPLLIEALSEIVRAQLRLNGENGARELWENVSEFVWVRKWLPEEELLVN